MELLLMDPHPTKPDEIIPEVKVLPSDKTYYIVGYEPLVTKEIAHHLVVRACKTTFEQKGKVKCAHDKEIPYIYAWARGAPALYLPPEVGFKFGQNSTIAALRMDVHFKDLSNVKDVDLKRIGVRILYTDTPQPKEASVFVMVSEGDILPNQTERIDNTCELKDDVKMHIFAFRTHAHQLGRVLSGYVGHPDPDGHVDWTLIGKKNPLLPQFFYPTKQEVLAQQGDLLAARCTMFNFKNHTVSTGLTDDDEMCVFYIMYWVDDGKFPALWYCQSSGPPKYRWENDPRLIDIPSDSDKLKK